MKPAAHPLLGQMGHKPAPTEDPYRLLPMAANAIDTFVAAANKAVSQPRATESVTKAMDTTVILT